MDQDNFSFDLLVDALAERLAAKLRPELGHANSTGIKPRLLDVKGAAAYLSRSQGSIRHLIEVGVIPTVPLDGRIFVDIQDLDAIIGKAKQSRKTDVAA
jgi:hypothetical protein